MDSTGMWFGMLFPAVGFVFVFLGLRKGFRGGKLLRIGKEATGEPVSKTATNTRVNDQTVYKYEFEFRVDGRVCSVTAKTHIGGRFSGENLDAPEWASADSVLEPLLYSPSNPKLAIMLDDLPGAPRINEQGKIEGRFWAALFTLFIPGVTIVGHGWWLLHVLEVV